MRNSAVDFLLLFHPSSRISSLSGILVPVAQYPDLRDDFYRLLTPLIRSGGAINPAPELHGCDFLKDESDETKFRILNGVVSLVLSHPLRVYRVGYFITPEIEKVFANDKKLTGMCFQSMLHMMEDVLATID